MDKQDYIYTGNNGYKLHIVSLIPNKPKRLLLIPPLIGASGVLGIRTFRYFFREGCALMSFDYCGHCTDVNNTFTLYGTFADTEAALSHAIKYAKKIRLPLHVVGACYGLIPLIQILNKWGWPPEVKSIFSVSGLLNINDILDFDYYKIYLKKMGIAFANKSAFVDYISTTKDDFISHKQTYIYAVTDYLTKVFAEISGIISYESFGTLKYSNIDFYKSFYEFMTIDLPEIIIPKRFPCIFFFGIQDNIFNLQSEKPKIQYLEKINKIAPHAKLYSLKIDHFGRGEDHYIIGKEGMKFLVNSELKRTQRLS